MQKLKGKVKKTASAIASLALAFAITLGGVSVSTAYAATPTATKSGKYYTDFATHEEERAAANSFNEEIVEEGSVLLKNKDNALPLKNYEKNISLFGIRSVNLQLGGSGSGGGSSSGAKSLQDSFKDAGFNVNPALTELYKTTTPERVAISTSMFGANYFQLELATSIVDKAKDSYKKYDDAAIIVISRAGSEGADMSVSFAAGNNNNADKHVLELTDSEVELVEYVTELKKAGVFNKVIMLINAANAMELGSLHYNDDIDAMLWMGQPGTSGAMAVGRIFNGTVNPSGRLVDVYPSDLKKDPSWYNFGDNKQNHIGTDGSLDVQYINVRNEASPEIQYRNTAFRDNETPSATSGGYFSLDYEEGIYMGYRWYETADAEGYFDRTVAATGTDKGTVEHGDNYYNLYNGVVYPFGYGMSYTTFDWTMERVSAENWNGKSSIEVKVTVKNTGKVAGKDVVEIYSSAPYATGGIEKAEVDLVDYAKTKVLEPGESQTLTFKLSPQQLAEFDDGKYEGEYGAYVLDPGKYTISARSDSHNVKGTVDFTLGATSYVKNSEAKAQTGATIITNDETTGARIQTWFSKDDGANYSVRTAQNSKTDMNVTSREYFKAAADDAGKYSDNHGLYHPSTATIDDLIFNDETLNLMNKQMVATVSTAGTNSVKMMDSETFNSQWNVTAADITALKWKQASEADVAARKDGKTDIQLKDMTGLDFDDPKWDEYLNSMTWEELVTLVSSGMFGTPALESIGKPASSDADGPAQLSSGTFWACEVMIASTWNVDIAEKQGWFVGNDSLFLGVNGWYGPGIDTHRSAFGGRNFEYYSQDGVQGGKIFAGVTKGAQSKGVHVYAKHFVLNDQEMGRDIYGGICTWVPEQALRKIYVKMVEYAVKDGDLNGTMTAFNRIGMMSCASSNLIQGLMETEFGYHGVNVTDMYGASTGGASWPANRMIRAHIYPLGQYSGTANIVYGVYDATANMVKVTEKDGLQVAAGTEGAETFDSPTQWKSVRDTAKRSLYVAANANLMKNSVDTSKFVDQTLKFSSGVSVGNNVSIAVAAKDFGTEIRSAEYAITEGALPAGLTLTSAGAITGTPTGAGTYEATITLTVDRYITETAKLTIEVGPAFTLNKLTASIGAEYDGLISSERITVGEGAYDSISFAVTKGALPKGVVLDTETGALVGTPLESGVFNFSVTATADRQVTSWWYGTYIQTDVFTDDFTLTVEESAAIEAPEYVEKDQMGTAIKDAVDAALKEVDAKVDAKIEASDKVEPIVIVSTVISIVSVLVAGAAVVLYVLQNKKRG